jgi:hypothetical protein
MKDTMKLFKESVNEKLRQAVHNSHVLSNKLAKERQEMAQLEQQLLDQHQLAEKRQHDCLLLKMELQV